MTPQESVEYIEHRLGKVALDQEPIFSIPALQLIAVRARGVPRVLNIFCDNVLIAGFADQERPISVSLAREVIAELEVITYFHSHKLIEISLARDFIAKLEGQSASKKPAAKRKQLTIKASATAALVVLLGSLLYWQLDSLLAWQEGKLLRPLQLRNRTPELQEKKDSFAPQTSLTKPAASKPHAQELQPSAIAIASTSLELPVVQKTEKQEQKKITAEETTKPEKNSLSNAATEPPAQKFPLIRMVQKGDYLSKMIAEIYGKSSTQRVQWIKMHNPQILDENQLTVGMVITFPAFDESLDDQ